MKTEWKRKRKEIKGRTYLLITGKETWKKEERKSEGWCIDDLWKRNVNHKLEGGSSGISDGDGTVNNSSNDVVPFPLYTHKSASDIYHIKNKKKKNIRKEGMPIIQNPQRLLIQFTIIRNSILCFQTRQTKTFWPIFSCKDAIGFAWSVNISFMGYVKDGSYMASWVI